jgi:hypothetical protein
MPFTPFHMGPGMAFKAAAPRYFSIVVFALTQIALDLEVFWHLIQGSSPLHRFWHTFLGAAIVTAAFTLLGKPASQLIKTIWNRSFCQGTDCSVSVHTSWLASFTASAAGAYSHVLLDSVFHPDVQPFQPWSSANPLFQIISPMMLQMICIALGIIGLTWFFERESRRRRTTLLSPR